MKASCDKTTTCLATLMSSPDLYCGPPSISCISFQSSKTCLPGWLSATIATSTSFWCPRLWWCSWLWSTIIGSTSSFNLKPRHPVVLTTSTCWSILFTCINTCPPDAFLKGVVDDIISLEHYFSSFFITFILGQSSLWITRGNSNLVWCSLG